MFSMKPPNNERNSIYNVVRPMYVGARIFGFFPFSVKIQLHEKKRAVYFTIIDFIVFFIHLTIYAWLAYININNTFMKNSAAPPLLMLGIRTLLIFGLTSAILCISADLCNRHRIFNIFEQCQCFDIQVIVYHNLKKIA